MAVIGTFGSFTAARLGIYAAQASLSATGNNIANINTEGYTRQRMDLVSLYSYGTVRYANNYQQNIGYGVLTSSVSQLRDPFLDIRYREENASVGAYDEKLDCLDQLRNILDEVGKGNDDFGIIAAQLEDFLSQLQNLNGRVGEVVNDSTARGSAQTLTNLFNSYAKAMETIAENKRKKLGEDVDTVNSLLNQIRDLNVQIRDAGIAGDNALELRDARNLCIDKLSSYMKIDVWYDYEKIDEFNVVERINISIPSSDAGPGALLVQGVYTARMTMDEREPYLMTVEAPTDVKGRILRNAEHKEYESVTLGDNELHGSLQSLREFLTEKGEFSKDDDLRIDPQAAQKRGIQYYQNALDALARKFAEEFNKANQLNVDDVLDAYVVIDGNFVRSDGTLYRVPDVFYYLRDDKEELAKLEGWLDKGEISKADLDDHITFLQDKYAELAASGYNGEREPELRNRIQELETLKAKIEEKEQEDGDPIEVWELDEDDRDVLSVLIGGGAAREGEGGLASQVERETKEAYREIENLREADLQLTDKWSFYNGGILFSSNGDENNPNNITAKNITISAAWTTGEVRILNTKNPDGLDHSTANDNILHMIALMSQDLDYHPGEVINYIYDTDFANDNKKYFTGSFAERLADMNSILGVDLQTTELLYYEYSTTALSLENGRQSVAGVDLNDEATNMMVYQKAYAAACQLMTTLDSMLDKLINGTLR